MADEKEKRTLLGDIKKNIIDKIGNEDIMQGDITRYKVPKNLPEVPISISRVVFGSQFPVLNAQ